MTTLTCSRLGRMVGSRHDELSASDRAHAERCADCTRELGALEAIVTAGRELDAAPMDAARSERLRARLLEAARHPTVTRASRVPLAIAGIAVAAAALMALSLVLGHESSRDVVATSSSLDRAPQTTPDAGGRVTHGTVRASAGAHFTLLSDAPDEIVRLVDGAITVSVLPLRTGERFRVVVGDAEVEVRGTAFEVAAHDDRLASVDVLHGVVEVRADGHAPVVVRTGERWVPAADDHAAAELDEEASRVIAEAPPRGDPSPHARRARPTTSEVSAPPPRDAPTWTAASGFETGWDALRSGDLSQAVTDFAEVVARAPTDPLAEDASFWRCVALSRASRTSESRAALESFLVSYPRSVRAPEAAVMLGWLLVESGDTAGARAMFERGARGTTERVRASAARGLASLVESP